MFRGILMENQKKIILNRIVSFVAGGLLIFAVMSFTVVNTVKTENTELAKALEISKFEAGRLLADAKAQFAAGDLEEAKISLTNLFDNQPGSKEAEEGRILFPQIENAEAFLNTKWEKALPGIKAEWRKAMTLELRAESEADRVKFENEIEGKIDRAWDKAKEKVRSEWMHKI